MRARRNSDLPGGRKPPFHLETRVNSRRLAVAGIVGAVLAVFLLCGGCWCMVPGIEPGHVGVVKTLNRLEDTPLPDGGPYFVQPWATVQRVNVQVQNNAEDATVPTKGGLSVKVRAVLLYRVRPETAPALIKEAKGGKYEEVFVDPIFRNCVRDVCAEHTPEDLYTVARNDVEAQVLARVQKELDPLGFECSKVMIQDPVLPQVVTERIQAKVAAEQDAIRMQSVYKQREQEAMANKRQKELAAEAQVIEAKCIADAQAIIQKDLSQEYLIYQWIEAMKEASKYGNSTIYVPTGPDGLPVMGAMKGPKK